MAILKIARMGHPVLLQMCDPVADPGAPEIRRLVADMIETMEDAPGVGLAAPQVHVPLRLFVFRVPEARAGRRSRRHGARHIGADQSRDRIADATSACCAGKAACRSPACAPRCRAHRASAIAASTATAAPVEREVTGFHAGVVQHEYDHLDGILYPMRMKDFSLFGFTEELARVAAARQEGR